MAKHMNDPEHNLNMGVDERGIDTVNIGQWLQVERMSKRGYDVHVGEYHFGVWVGKEGVRINLLEGPESND